jgi:hypothetical protein
MTTSCYVEPFGQHTAHCGHGHRTRTSPVAQGTSEGARRLIVSRSLCVFFSFVSAHLPARTLLIFVATLKLSRRLELSWIQLIDPNDLEGQRDIAIVGGAIVDNNNAPAGAAEEEEAL